MIVPVFREGIGNFAGRKVEQRGKMFQGVEKGTEPVE
jgi:hypothetical protein